ncbi:hypothetical protein ADUPG1_005749, partial [Aduncisulcus paluster]
MNKRFMRCVTLQQHATRLSNVWFSIPALLDVSSISGMDVMSAHSSSECIPLLFSTGVALGMFHDIKEMKSGCILFDASSAGSNVIETAF